MPVMPRVISETDDLLVLDKPAGLIVHSDGRTKEPSVAEWILDNYPKLRDVGEPWISPQGEKILLPGIVHRLDRTTSGVLLIAKTQEMYEYLKQQFKERKIEKYYLAYVWGHMEAEEGEIVAEIMRSSTPPKKWYARPCERTDKRAAITKWKLLEKREIEGEPVSYIEAQPLTGRTHQIRVHFASIGHPIVGDPLYGDREAKGRVCLHASRITLTLPNGQKATFEAPSPTDFPTR